MEPVSVNPHQQLLELTRMNQLIQMQRLLQMQTQSLGSASPNSSLQTLNNLKLNQLNTSNSFSKLNPGVLGSLTMPSLANLNPLQPMFTPSFYAPKPLGTSNFSPKDEGKTLKTISNIKKEQTKSATKPKKSIKRKATQDENFNGLNIIGDENANTLNKLNQNAKLTSRTPLAAINKTKQKRSNIKTEKSNRLQRLSPNIDSENIGTVKIEKRPYKLGKRIKLTKQESVSCLKNLDKGKSTTKEKKFKCVYPGCERLFAWKWSMETHALTHKGEAGRTHKCKYCDKGFFTVGCLKSHEKIHTRRKDAYICKAPDCGKKYSTSEGLRLHTRNHHTDDKKWVCPCDDCPRKFVRQADLRLHIIRIHSNERPYPCIVPGCSKAFACFSELKRHNLVHKKKQDLKATLKKQLKPGAAGKNKQKIPECKEEYLAAQALAGF